MGITLSAKQWRKIWEQLYNSGEINISGRIDHDLGHIWNGNNWDEQVTLDFSDEFLTDVRDDRDSTKRVMTHSCDRMGNPPYIVDMNQSGLLLLH
jgi:hypothetical protein